MKGSGEIRLRRLQVIEPGIVQLAFGFELAGAGDEPVAVVSGDLGGLEVKTAEFPVGSRLLQNHGKHGSSLGRNRVEKNDAVFAGGRLSR